MQWQFPSLAQVQWQVSKVVDVDQLVNKRSKESIVEQGMVEIQADNSDIFPVSLLQHCYYWNAFAFL